MRTAVAPVQDSLSPEAAEELFEVLPVSLQQCIARGEVSLEQLLEDLTSAKDAEICPWCGSRSVASKQLGVCHVCARKRLTEIQEERLSALEALREANRIKTRVKRMHDELEPGRPKRIQRRFSAQECGRWMQPTNSPVMRSCTACGHPFPDRGESVCAACEERVGRRAAKS